MCRDFGAWEVGQWTNYRAQAKPRLELATRPQIARRDRETKALGGPERVFLSPEPALSEAEGLLSKTGANLPPGVAEPAPLTLGLS